MTKQSFDTQAERRATLQRVREQGSTLSQFEHRKPSNEPLAPGEQERRDRIEHICRRAIVETAVNEIIEEQKCQSQQTCPSSVRSF